MFYSTILLLAAIYIFYTIPLTFATGLVDPGKWDNLFPRSREWTQGSFYTQYLSGILPALLWTTFFALCPLMFKSLANFGSNALSVLGAGKFSITGRQLFQIAREKRLMKIVTGCDNRVYCSSVLLVVYDHHRFFRLVFIDNVHKRVQYISFGRYYHREPSAAGACEHSCCDPDSDIRPVAELDYCSNNDYASSSLYASSQHVLLFMPGLALLLENG